MEPETAGEMPAVGWVERRKAARGPPSPSFLEVELVGIRPAGLDFGRELGLEVVTQRDQPRGRGEVPQQDHPRRAVSTPSSGVLSVALSSAAGWYRLIPPALSKKKRFSFFCFIAG